MNVEEILDEDNVKKRPQNGLHKEVNLLAWWVTAAGILAIIGAILYLCAYLFAFSETRGFQYGASQDFYWFTTWAVAALCIIFFGYQNIRWRKALKTMSQSEKQEDWLAAAQKQYKIWRWGAIIFLLMGTPPIYLAGTGLYHEYQWRTAGAEEAIEIPTTWEEPTTEWDEVLQEAPAPLPPPSEVED